MYCASKPTLATGNCLSPPKKDLNFNAEAKLSVVNLFKFLNYLAFCSVKLRMSAYRHCVSGADHNFWVIFYWVILDLKSEFNNNTSRHLLSASFTNHLTPLSTSIQNWNWKNTVSAIKISLNMWRLRIDSLGCVVAGAASWRTRIVLIVAPLVLKT